MSNLVLLSGGFDPVHRGHIAMIEEASKKGDVFILLNSDEWLTRKKGRPFMRFTERQYVLEHIVGVSKVLTVLDSDNTVCAGIETVVEQYGGTHKIYFANGGDRKNDNVPEVMVCKNLGVTLLWNMGGEKAQSSSDLLRNWVEG